MEMMYAVTFELYKFEAQVFRQFLARAKLRIHPFFEVVAGKLYRGLDS